MKTMKSMVGFVSQSGPAICHCHFAVSWNSLMNLEVNECTDLNHTEWPENEKKLTCKTTLQMRVMKYVADEEFESLKQYPRLTHRFWWMVVWFLVLWFRHTTPIKIFVDDLSEKKASRKPWEIRGSHGYWSALDFLCWKLQVSTSKVRSKSSQDLASGSGHDSVAVVVGHSGFHYKVTGSCLTGCSNMDRERSCQIWIG